MRYWIVVADWKGSPCGDAAIHTDEKLAWAYARELVDEQFTNLSYVHTICVDGEDAVVKDWTPALRIEIENACRYDDDVTRLKARFAAGMW
jgi:hypothetical protein